MKYRIEWPGDARDERVRGLVFMSSEAALQHVKGMWGGWLGLRAHGTGVWVAAPNARIIEVSGG